MNRSHRGSYEPFNVTAIVWLPQGPVAQFDPIFLCSTHERVRMKLLCVVEMDFIWGRVDSDCPGMAWSLGPGVNDAVPTASSREAGSGDDAIGLGTPADGRCRMKPEPVSPLTSRERIFLLARISRKFPILTSGAEYRGRCSMRPILYMRRKSGGAYCRATFDYRGNIRPWICR